MLIYLVEDDDNIRELVLYTLRSTGFEAMGFPDAEQFWKTLPQAMPDLVLLDIMLPDEDGLQILRRLRDAAETERLPVIMLTAKGTEYDKVVGLDSGADDYIPKPFGMMELISRVKALLRRTTKPAMGQDFRSRLLTVDAKGHAVTVNGRPIVLTLKEFELLCVLIENRDTVLTRDRLLNQIWGYSYSGETRTVDVHIRTLRQKLGEADGHIETVRGVGYRFVERPRKEEPTGS